MAVLLGCFLVLCFSFHLGGLALATVSSGSSAFVCSFVVADEKKQTTHRIMEWNEFFGFFMFIHFNKFLNFSQPRQLMNASLFLSRFSRTIFFFLPPTSFVHVLFFRYSFFVFAHTTRARVVFSSIVLSRKTELFLFCILSSKSVSMSVGYCGANAYAK